MDRGNHANSFVATRSWLPRLVLAGGMSIAALGVAGATAPLADAATQTLAVTTFTDPGVSDCPAATNPCSLREAIIVANGDTGDTISLPAGTYILSDYLPEITASMTITGASAATTIIDGATATNSTFNVGGGTVDLSGLTIQDAVNNGGGGDGGVTVYDDVSSPVVDVTDVAVIDNSAPYVGGWFNGGGSTTNMTDVTISGNRTTTGDSDYAAGLRNDGAMTLTNVTIANNVASSGTTAAGGIENTGTLTIVNSDIVGNVGDGDTETGIGGIYIAGGSVDSVNSIVSGNTNDSTGPTNCNGAVNATSHDIEDGTTCGFDGTGDLDANPDLGALADNGGPLQTEALLSGSPAIDAGLNSSCPTDDERGDVRITASDPTCDIGAYEYGAGASGATVPVPASGAGTAPASPWFAMLLIGGLGLTVAALLIRRRESAA